ncbi:MAG: cobaltochelatase subunit CobN, partial [Oricola sp.]
MHLLLAQKGTISDGDGEAIDLGQTPGDICFLSAADTELASLASVHDGREPALRLVNLLQLKHPMSVDTWVERTGKHAKLIVVRILGGAGYWPYGLEAIHAAAVAHGVKLAVLPGDDKSDPGLARFCTLPADFCTALWRFLIEGGAGNARGFLDACGDILAGREIEADASPLLKAGVFGEIVTGNAGTVAIVFYRALVQAGQTAPIEALARALSARGLAVLPVYVSSLKDPVSAATVEALFDRHRPDVVLNATGFAVSAPGADRTPTVLEKDGAPVIQVVLSGSSRENWAASSQGLNARDLAMNVALPEVDGRVLSRAVSFKSASAWDAATQCNVVTHEPVADRVDFVAELASRWVRLRRKKPAEKRVAIVLANYPNRDGRLANGVGLDTPAGTVEVLRAMGETGFAVGDIPADGDALIDHLKRGPTNAAADAREIRETISASQYTGFFDRLPLSVQEQVTARWGAPETDPFFRNGVFALPLARFGETLVGIQPARGYNIDPKESYHSPDLVPPHGYIAFYAYLRDVHGVDAVVHMGKHGNLEWLPGKALALSATCWPEAVFGPLPHVYPFIVNDPGEGTQAKRRTAAVIIDHLTPPLTRAESYGPLKDLEALVDEYYEAAGGDPRRLKVLKTRILDLVRDIGLDHDAGIGRDDASDDALAKLDAYLCDLKEMQIRDGLHIFGKAPEGRLLTDLVVALARVPRGLGEGADASLQRAIAADVLGAVPPSVACGDISPARGESGAMAFDPLDCDMRVRWTGPRPEMLEEVSDDPWRTAGDTVERIELLAARLVGGESPCPADWSRTKA